MTKLFYLFKFPPDFFTYSTYTCKNCNRINKKKKFQATTGTAATAGMTATGGMPGKIKIRNRKGTNKSRNATWNFCNNRNFCYSRNAINSRKPHQQHEYQQQLVPFFKIRLDQNKKQVGL